MYRKLLISAVILLAVVFSFNICFANNGLQNAADGVKNVVGNAENAVEGTARDISNASKNATGAMENTANNIGNNMMNATNDAANDVSTGMTATTNNNYTATRTATTGDTTFMGMNSTVWTWLILGVAAIAIVALVWYYSAQFASSNYRDRD